MIEEARLLDERRFREWMALFADDGSYWVPSMPGQKSPHNQASLFYDDRDLMKTRIERLEHPRIHVQTPPSRTAHLVGNVVIEEADAGNGDFLSARHSSWWNIAMTRSACSPGVSIIGCGGRVTLSASCKSAST